MDEKLKEETLLIIQFLNWKKIGYKEYQTPFFQTYINVSRSLSQTSIYNIDKMEFHTDWNWLMICLQKILDITFSDESQETFDSELFYSIRDFIPDINSTYRAVIDFIKLYNQNKLKQ